MKKLSRKKPNREHMIRNLAASLVLYETVDTTEAKAKTVKTVLEKVIARNKENTLSAKRNIFKFFFDDNASRKVINELVPRYQERTSGFIKSYRLKNRLGDNAEMMRLELVDKKVFVDKVVEGTKEEKSASETVIKEKIKAKKA